MFTQILLGMSLVFNTIVVDQTTDKLIENGKIKEPIIVYIVGGIGESGAQEFSQKIQAALETGQTIIPIIITSYGGSVYSLLKMMDVVEAAKKKVIVATIIEGYAMSAGAVLASCGTNGYRYIAPNATILIHEVSTGEEGKIGEVANGVEEAKRLNKILLTTISKNIGKDESFIEKTIFNKGHADWYIPAKQAVLFNLANKIGMPNLILKATTTLKLE
jgi:ATP-dependent Clp protease protease subunit